MQWGVGVLAIDFRGGGDDAARVMCGGGMQHYLRASKVAINRFNGVIHDVLNTEGCS